MSQNSEKIPFSNASQDTRRAPAAAGDIQTILAEIRPVMRNYALSLTNGNSHTVDEILQESLLHVWQHRDALPIPEKIRPWALRIVYFKALSLRRDRSREPFVGFSEETTEYLAQALPEKLAFSDVQINALAECLKAMPAGDIQLLHRHYRENLSLKTIAEELGKNENALWQKFFRLRNALRRCVEKKLRGVRNA